jgi:hypothetical protein
MATAEEQATFDKAMQLLKEGDDIAALPLGNTLQDSILKEKFFDAFAPHYVKRMSAHLDKKNAEDEARIAVMKKQVEALQLEKPKKSSSVGLVVIALIVVVGIALLIWFVWK